MMKAVSSTAVAAPATEATAAAAAAAEPVAVAGRPKWDGTSDLGCRTMTA